MIEYKTLVKENNIDLKYSIKEDWPTKGVRFIDLTTTMLDPKSFNYIVESLARLVPHEVKYIISPESRGFIWGAAVANRLGLGFIPIRKAGKLPDVGGHYEYSTEYSKDAMEISDYKQEHWEQCFFIDDVYATGGSYVACKELAMNKLLYTVGGEVIYNVGINERKDVLSLFKGEEL